jgi:hypothetical protein
MRSRVATIVVLLALTAPAVAGAHRSELASSTTSRRGSIRGWSARTWSIRGRRAGLGTACMTVSGWITDCPCRFGATCRAGRSEPSAARGKTEWASSRAPCPDESRP